MTCGDFMSRNNQFILLINDVILFCFILILAYLHLRVGRSDWLWSWYTREPYGTIVGSCFMWNISPCSLSHMCKRILFHWQMWMVFCVSLVWLWIPVTSPSRWCQFGYSCLLTDLYCCVKESIYHFARCFWLGLNKIRNSFYVCHVCTDEIVRYLLQRPL